MYFSFPDAYSRRRGIGVFAQMAAALARQAFAFGTLALRSAVLFGATLLGLMFSATGAQAVTISSLSANPTSFTNSGTVITFTMSFNTGGRAWNSATFANSGNVHAFGNVSCPAGNNQTNQNITCTFTYTTQAGDTSGSVSV